MPRPARGATCLFFTHQAEVPSAGPGRGRAWAGPVEEQRGSGCSRFRVLTVLITKT